LSVVAVAVAVVCRGAVATRQQNQRSVNEFELTLSELPYTVTRILTGRIEGLRRHWHWYRQQHQQYNERVAGRITVTNISTGEPTTAATTGNRWRFRIVFNGNSINNVMGRLRTVPTWCDPYHTVRYLVQVHRWLFTPLRDKNKNSNKLSIRKFELTAFDLTDTYSSHRDRYQFRFRICKILCLCINFRAGDGCPIIMQNI